MARDIVHGFYHKKMDEEIARVISNCDKLGVYMNKKEATALISEKSRRTFMNKQDIINFLMQIKKIR